MDLHPGQYLINTCIKFGSKIVVLFLFWSHPRLSHGPQHSVKKSSNEKQRKEIYLLRVATLGRGTNEEAQCLPPKSCFGVLM